MQLQAHLVLEDFFISEGNQIHAVSFLDCCIYKVSPPLPIRPNLHRQVSA